MRIAIIGAGQVGRAIGAGWSKARHDVVYGVRRAGDPDMAAFLARAGGREASVNTAALEAEAIALALPWQAAAAVLSNLGDLAGKIVIDCMNPLTMRDGVLQLDCGFDTSGAERVASWLPGARVVKTLNQVGAEVMADASGFALKPAMFVAGDDDAAKAAVLRLVADLGFDAMDAGALRQARYLEPLAMVWINQALMRGKGRDWAFAAAHRQASSTILNAEKQ